MKNNGPCRTCGGTRKTQTGCQPCGGSGNMHGRGRPIQCDRCKGVGVFNHTCTACGGTGRQR